MFWLKPCSNSFCFSKFKEEWPTQCHNKHVCIIPLILGLPCWLLNSAHFSLETLHLAGKLEELHVVTSKELKFIMQSMQHKKTATSGPLFCINMGWNFPHSALNIMPCICSCLVIAQATICNLCPCTGVHNSPQVCSCASHGLHAHFFSFLSNPLGLST